MKITEENVVIQIRKRNEKALYFIIDQYGGLIKSIVQKHLASFQDVQEECMDYVLLAIWKARRSCNENYTDACPNFW